MRSVKPSKASLRSKDAFTLRRSQILLASSRGEHAPRIAHSLGCGQQTVRDAIHEFNQRGLGMLSGPSPRAPKEPARPSTKNRAPRLLGRCSTALGGSSDTTLEPWDFGDGCRGCLRGGAFTQRQVSGQTIRPPWRAQCEVCGNEYDKAFQVSMPGGDARTFDSFECAIHALAPTCEYCGVKVIGHGIEANDSFYCCAHCARMAGAEDVSDRA